VSIAVSSPLVAKLEISPAPACETAALTANATAVLNATIMSSFADSAVQYLGANDTKADFDEAIRLKPKSSGNAVVLTISGAKNVDASAVDAANVGEIVIKPKASDAAVVLTTSRGKVVKASVKAKPEHLARSP
jgi:hypothetical protein